MIGWVTSVNFLPETERLEASMHVHLDVAKKNLWKILLGVGSCYASYIAVRLGRTCKFWLQQTLKSWSSSVQYTWKDVESMFGRYTEVYNNPGRLIEAIFCRYTGVDNKPEMLVVDMSGRYTEVYIGRYTGVDNKPGRLVAAMFGRVAEAYSDPRKSARSWKPGWTEDSMAPNAAT